MFESYPSIVNIEHITEMLNVSKSSAYTLLHSNQIKHVKIGRKYIVPKQAVIAFIEQTCYNGSQIIDSGQPFIVKEGEIV